LDAREHNIADQQSVSLGNWIYWRGFYFQRETQPKKDSRFGYLFTRINLVVMKLKFIHVFSVFIVIVGSAICSNANAQAFTAAQLDSANTAKSITQLSSEEKNVIKFINLARMYPKQFAKNYVAKYDEKKTGFDYGPAYAKDKASLISTLNETKSMKFTTSFS
jgi:hypothetical protein